MVDTAAEMFIGPDIVKAICAAMRDIGYVQGTGWNAHHKYKYVSEADLLKAVQPAMVTNALILTPIRVHTQEPQPSGNQIRQDILVTYLLAHVSGQFIRAQAPGSGTDSLDKAIYKAMTGAYKYILRQTFAIPSGDDAEREYGKPEKTGPKKKVAKKNSDPDWLRPVGEALAEFQGNMQRTLSDVRSLVKEHGGADLLRDVLPIAVPTILTRLALEYRESEFSGETPKLLAAEDLF